MNKKLASILLTAVSLTLLPVSAFADSNFINTGTINNSGIINNGTIIVQFNDIQANNWAFEAVSSMSKRNVISGYEDGTFRPDNPISREEFAKMLSMTFSLDLSVTNAVYYSDVTPNRWSYPYIEVTKEYISAYYPPKGQPFFDPTANATREDVATALVKIVGLKTDKYSTHFTDENDISPGLKKYVDVAADHNLISGYPDGSFKPSNPITRAEIATLLYRAIKGIKGDDSSPSATPAASFGQTAQPAPATKESSANAPDLWADVVKESTTPAVEGFSSSPINILIKGGTTPGATVTVNGERVNTDSNGGFSLEVPVTKDGTYAFEIKSNYMGQVTTINKSLTVIIDSPKLTLENPAPSVSRVNTDVNIWFDWTDPNDSNPTLFVNGQKRSYGLGGGTSNGGYNGVLSVNLQDGENDLTLKLVNKYGKESNTVTKVVYYQPSN